MKPSLSQFLMGAAATLNRDVAPHVRGSRYALGHVGTLGLLMTLMAQETERAADTLVHEQDTLRGLFADAAKQPLAPDLRARLAAAGVPVERTSYRLSDLERDAAALNTLLIELHQAVEGNPFDWAETLEQRILEVLKLGAECRALYLPSL